jgi:hypothetical protein
MRLLTRAFCVMCVASAAGCVRYDRAGRYPVPTVVPARSAQSKIPLRVALSPFRVDTGAQVSGRGFSRALRARRAVTNESKRLTTSFFRHLQASQLFAALRRTTDTESNQPAGLQSTQVLLAGKITSLRQGKQAQKGIRSSGGGSGGGILLAIFAVYGVGVLFGAPTDSDDGAATIELDAIDRKTGVVFHRFRAHSKERAYAGLYYRGWPLGKALRHAASRLIEQLKRHGSTLAQRVRTIEAWRARYGLDASSRGKGGMSSADRTSRLIDALGDPDPCIRGRAVIALGSKARLEQNGRRALISALGDPSWPVKRLALHAVVGAELTDDMTLAAVSRLTVSRRGSLTRRSRLARASKTVLRQLRFLSAAKRCCSRGSKLFALVRDLGAVQQSRRIAACRAIGRQKKHAQRVLPAVLVALEDRRFAVRAATVSALANLAAFAGPARRLVGRTGQCIQQSHRANARTPRLRALVSRRDAYLQRRSDAPAPSACQSKYRARTAAQRHGMPVAQRGRFSLSARRVCLDVADEAALSRPEPRAEQAAKRPRHRQSVVARPGAACSRSNST